MTWIFLDLANRKRVRFDMDPPLLSEGNDFPVARVTTPRGQPVFGVN